MHFPALNNDFELLIFGGNDEANYSMEW